MNNNNQILVIASLANGACFSMILPLLAPLSRQLSLSEFQAGLMVSVGALLMALAAIWISKRPNFLSISQLMTIGFVGMTLTWGMFAAVLSYGVTYSISIGLLFALLLLARASTGVFMAMPQIALQGYIMTKYQDETSRGQTMAKFGALNSAGLILGPFATTVLIGFGILVPLWFAIVVLVCISILIVLRFKSVENNGVSHSKTQRVDKQAQPTHQEKLHLKNIAVWLALGFSLYIAIVTLNLTAGFYLQDQFKLSISESALYFSQCSLLVGFTLVCMQVCIAKWLRWSVYRLLSVGLICMLLGLFISIGAQHIRIFQAAYVFYGIAVACLLPAFTTGAAQSAPLDLQAKVAALCTTAQALSFVIAPLLSTAIYQLNIVFPFYLLILIFIIIAAYFSFYFKFSVLNQAN